MADVVKNHSEKEIERTHHLFAIDHVNKLYKNKNLSENEKNEIFERFLKYKNTINEIKTQLDSCCIKPLKVINFIASAAVAAAVEI